MKKAFVFTMDVLLAFLYASTFITVIYENVPVSQDLYRDAMLYDYSLDLLTVMDKAGYLHELSRRKLVNAQKLISETPEQYCFYLRIYDESGDKVGMVKKHGCRGKHDVNVYVRRTFVHEGYPYTAELGSWYKLKQLKGD